MHIFVYTLPYLNDHPPFCGLQEEWNVWLGEKQGWVALTRILFYRDLLFSMVEVRWELCVRLSLLFLISGGFYFLVQIMTKISWNMCPGEIPITEWFTEINLFQGSRTSIMWNINYLLLLSITLIYRLKVKFLRHRSVILTYKNEH